MVQNAEIGQAEQWERELVRQTVECQFAEEHRDAVLAELASIRSAKVVATTRWGGVDREERIRHVVRAQLEAIVQSAGDPGFFTERRYQQMDDDLSLDRDVLYGIHATVEYHQLMAKDVPSLIKMIDDDTTWLDALSALERKGGEAGIAVPRLVELLNETDQLECCKVLRTLKGIGPAAQGALSAVIELASDPDYLISLEARAALKAIAPARAAEWGIDK